MGKRSPNGPAPRLRPTQARGARNAARRVGAGVHEPSRAEGLDDALHALADGEMDRGRQFTLPTKTEIRQ